MMDFIDEIDKDICLNKGKTCVSSRKSNAIRLWLCAFDSAPLTERMWDAQNSSVLAHW
jgi:hypothetical protein